MAGASLRYDYDPDLVRELLGHMVPTNMLLMVVAREFKGKTDKVRGARGVKVVAAREFEGKTDTVREGSRGYHMGGGCTHIGACRSR